MIFCFVCVFGERVSLCCFMETDTSQQLSLNPPAKAKLRVTVELSNCRVVDRSRRPCKSARVVTRRSNTNAARRVAAPSRNSPPGIVGVTSRGKTQLAGLTEGRCRMPVALVVEPKSS